jgi:redox-sensitive bicupin YhaK (pirin superfamily)
VILPRARDIGGFSVGRVLPSIERRMVGPFVFFDEMGPALLPAGHGVDVRPHPHIGLATVTYLLDGAIVHRDSLGFEQVIRPGEVNWMTAGRGIAHSERTGPELRQSGSRLYGVQTWVALPKAHEETAPAFAHHGRAALPVIADHEKRLRLIAGALYGQRAPVATFSEMFYADAELADGARLPLPPDYEERAVFILEGKASLAGQSFEAGRLLVLQPGVEILIEAEGRARLLLLGGEPMDGPRHLWWNFVSSSTERIEQAKEDWRAGRFAAVPGDDEFIPLPE